MGYTIQSRAQGIGGAIGPRDLVELAVYANTVVWIRLSSANAFTLAPPRRSCAVLTRLDDRRRRTDSTHSDWAVGPDTHIQIQPRCHRAGVRHDRMFVPGPCPAKNRHRRGPQRDRHGASREWPEFRERFARLRESVRLMRELWQGNRVDFDGEYYTARGASVYDAPETASRSTSPQAAQSQPATPAAPAMGSSAPRAKAWGCIPRAFCLQPKKVPPRPSGISSTSIE